MSLKASALKNNEAQRKAIAKESACILGRIDDELKNAHDQGYTSHTTNLPITFQVPYMKNNDAQRAIYYKVLSSLLEREFHVELELKKNATTFYIKWFSDEELEDVQRQTELIAMHTKKDLANRDVE